MSTFVGWGGGPWGSAPWGSGGVGTLTLDEALAIKENVIRLTFSQPIYFSTILDPPDGSIVTKYVTGVVAGTVGRDGEPVHPVNVIAVALATVQGGIDQADYGRIVDVTLDRPMSPYPARYTITVSGIFSEDLVFELGATTFGFYANFKQLQPPQIDTPRPSRDMANPQTDSGLTDTIPNPNAGQLGTFPVDASGDYAFDEGIENFKKRVFRRLVTSPGKFAHLPGYGVGVPDYGKRLAVSAIITSLASQAETQIQLEPETAKVRVLPVVDPNVPGLVRFRVLVQMRSGSGQRFDVPFDTAG